MNISPNKVPIDAVVKSLLLRQKDFIGVGYAAALAVAKDVWIPSNFKGVKDSKRFAVRVNKSINSIELPDDYVQFSTIYAEKDGQIIPMFVNPKLSEDIIDLSANKSCDCGCDLCANVRNYELIESRVTMNDQNGDPQVFIKTVRKKLNPDGSYLLETTEPVMKFQGGIHVATVLETTSEELCKLELLDDDSGCVKDCEDNRKKIYGHCGFHDIRHDCGAPLLPDECGRFKPEFNINDKGNRIVLPSNHSYENIVVRYYYDLKTKDIMVPQVYKKLFMLLIQWELIEFDMKVPMYFKKQIQSSITAEEREFLTNISRLSITRIYNLIYPKRVF